jgi:hypothetical protein
MHSRCSDWIASTAGVKVMPWRSVFGMGWAVMPLDSQYPFSARRQAMSRASGLTARG